ncbi:uncharacterized protein LOC129582245 isoform X2 [Paramacrobiotus metropolitanus]|uniref:uncharacterized protein LOC129582245 isoform X2 n=1 Tax=Paramacrobiotus metropolitanus TaxID=2943436 RepID=UPI0024456EEE|nr:uncharacterized protein LOC129582245 isoform X2 [Paramacrobiotus metropolitanus]
MYGADEESVVLGSTCQYRYQSTDCLARGAFGQVYIATVTERGNFAGDETVAIKVIQLDTAKLLRNSENYTKLREKCELLLKIKHNHVVRHHQITIHFPKREGTLLCVEPMMEYYHEKDLACLLNKLKQDGSVLKSQTAARYTQEIAQALHFLHQNHIIHGDLKPGNILVKRLGQLGDQLIICDLDDIMVCMQRDVTCSTDMTHVRGTIRYMSPEMLEKFTLTEAERMGRRPPGRKTDMWSLGCVIVKLAHCVLGNHRDWLQSADGDMTEAGEETTDNRYAMMIVDGYTPVISTLAPPALAECGRNCLQSVSDYRSSADVIIQCLSEKAELPQDNIIILHRIFDGSNRYSLYAQSFHPATTRLWQFPMPARLRRKYFGQIIGVYQNQVLCQVTEMHDGSPSRIFQTMTWDVVKQTCLSVPMEPQTALMKCPVVIGRLLYFWDIRCRSFKKVDLLQSSGSVVEDLPVCRNLNRSSKIMYVECFDTVTNAWSILPRLPGRRCAFATVVLQNYVYILGGRSVFVWSVETLRSCARLNWTTRTWEPLPSLRNARSNHCAFVTNSRVGVFGGRIENDYALSLSTMEMYDPENNEWTSSKITSLDSADTRVLFSSYDSQAVAFQPVVLEEEKTGQS